MLVRIFLTSYWKWAGTEQIAVGSIWPKGSENWMISGFQLMTNFHSHFHHMLAIYRSELFIRNDIELKSLHEFFIVTDARSVVRSAGCYPAFINNLTAGSQLNATTLLPKTYINWSVNVYSRLKVNILNFPFWCTIQWTAFDNNAAILFVATSEALLKKNGN